MARRLGWAPRLIAACAVALLGAAYLRDVLAQLVCNVLYTRSIGLGAWLGAQVTLSPANLWSLLGGWLMLLGAAFLFSPRFRGVQPWFRRHGVLIGLLSALPLFELALQPLLYEEPPPNALTRCAGDTAANEPNSSRHAPARGTDPTFDVHHNALGLRGPDLVPKRPTVVVVGDSMVYGTGVGDHETLPAQLEALLPGHQVANAGLQGDNLVGAIRRAQRLVERLRPVALVIGVYSNDTTNGSSSALCAMAPWCQRQVSHNEVDDLESRRLSRRSELEPLLPGASGAP